MNLTHHHRNALRFSCAPVRGAWPFSDPNELYAHPFIPARVTSLGGYSLLYYDLRTGDVFCPDCAAFERFRARLHPDVHWEGPSEQCAGCGCELPSAYGDPDQEEQKV